MTDNSTAKKSTPHNREKYKDEIAKMLNQMHTLKERIQKIREEFPWRPELDIELERLVIICKEKYRYINFLAEWPKTEYFDVWKANNPDEYAPSDTMAYAWHAVSFINAYPEELHEAITDNSKQSTLFSPEESDEEIKPETIKIWRSFKEKPTEIRRLEILAERALLEGAAEEIDAWILPEGVVNVENIVTKAPTEYPWPLSKVSQLAFGVIGADTPPLSLEQRGSKRKISLSANIWAINEIGERITKREALNAIESLTPFDKSVHNAIGVLYCSGNKYITPQMIDNAMKADGSKYLPPEDKRSEDIIKSVRKLFRHRIVLDATHTDKGGEGAYCTLIPRRYDNALIPGKFIEYGKKQLNGYEVSSWFEIYDMPPLYEYSNDINQITRYKPELMALPGKNYTTDAIIIRDEIVERLRIMQNAKNRGKNNVSHKILLSPIYSLIGIPDGNTPALRKRRAFARSVIKDILMNWENQGEIKGYEEEKGARGVINAFVIKL